MEYALQCTIPGLPEAGLIYMFMTNTFTEWSEW